jgi:hypothetical protein
MRMDFGKAAVFPLQGAAGLIDPVNEWFPPKRSEQRLELFAPQLKEGSGFTATPFFEQGVGFFVTLGKVVGGASKKLLRREEKAEAKDFAIGREPNGGNCRRCRGGGWGGLAWVRFVCFFDGGDRRSLLRRWVFGLLASDETGGNRMGANLPSSSGRAIAAVFRKNERLEVETGSETSGALTHLGRQKGVLPFYFPDGAGFHEPARFFQDGPAAEVHEHVF